MVGEKEKIASEGEELTINLGIERKANGEK